jgi:sarcosine oxidase subunit alpha
MLFWNAQWRLNVDITNVTAAYAAVNIAGPKSREVLAKLCDDVDLSKEGFPYLELRVGTVAGLPARLLRVGFVGELGYEIHVGASQGEALWDALMEAGKDLDIKPCGIETQRMLRLEKGHVIISQDTDGATHPDEIHMTWAVSGKKPFFVGGRSINVIRNREQAVKRQLVGFTLSDSTVPDESNLILDESNTIIGFITSVMYSPNVGKTIGMAYTKPERSKPGTEIRIKLNDGRVVSGEVATLPFIDPDNERQAM